MKKVFIDGGSGTTGLRIRERLAERKDIELVILSEENRKDPAARKAAINGSDIVFLCLPDDAAIEAVSFADNPDTVIIDTSTAHRTNDAWAYGFPELSGQSGKIKNSKRIANPGCHASGFIALVEPMVKAGIIKPDAALSCFSVTGYSGGGKKMIAQYQQSNDALLLAPRMYGLTQKHKHLPEMAKVCGLDTDPVFCPVVSNFYAGMEVTVPLFPKALGAGIADLEAVYKDYYSSESGLVHFVKPADEEGYLASNKLAGRDDMEVTVFGNDERAILVSRFDNLGKGASGAAIQNMNIILGLAETTGLVTGR